MLEREESNKSKKNKKPEKSKLMKILTFECLSGILDGISKFEIINVLMIIMSFANLALKYGYDTVVWEKVSTGVKASAEKQTDLDSSEDKFMEFA
jgi:hypothetical protein